MERIARSCPRLARRLTCRGQLFDPAVLVNRPRQTRAYPYGIRLYTNSPGKNDSCTSVEATTSWLDLDVKDSLEYDDVGEDAQTFQIPKEASGLVGRPDAPPLTVFSLKPRRRKVAIFFGYVGTGFRGSNLNRNSAPGETVEEFLMDAIFKCGGIHKSVLYNEMLLNWSRMSRTDKGAHSMFNVVSTSVLVRDDNVWDNDLWGFGLAHELNQCLPTSIRVFSVQQVRTNFSARRFCGGREYHYWLPVSALKVDGEMSESNIDARVSRLNRLLSRFVGSNYFHNFSKGIGDKSKREDPVEQEKRKVHSISFGEKPLEMSWLQPSMSLPRGVKSSKRFIEQAVCSPPEYIQPNSPLSVKVSIQGDSFMYQQVRMMIGTCVAIVNQDLPDDFLDLCMCKYVTIHRLPSVPPDFLLLASAHFKKDITPKGIKCKEGIPNLAFGKTAEELSKSFWKIKIGPHIAEALGNQVIWDNFRDDLKHHFDYDKQVIAQMLGHYTAYKNGETLL
uniref:Pseudouridine synthase I TruA alpha/beta domain-containing protein n=1 Tax=Mucochytrium quahogii TaxID=96639 RepID=A0A7S2SHW7_9STRA|mmetsp:Transcript_35548/g.56901  ORF Transcript_35548/g.56901 Transcript_35548/m.56901 type:complete len:503 (+) Transcript_35548:126-1634(+)